MFVIFRKIKPKVRAKNPRWKKHSKNAKLVVLEIIESIKINNPDMQIFEYNRIFIRNQKTRWGSCSSNKNLNFNYRIVFLPKELAHYLVVHELCHLIHFNHSKDFWNLVNLFCPEYKKHQKELQKFDVKKVIKELSISTGF